MSHSLLKKFRCGLLALSFFASLTIWLMSAADGGEIQLTIFNEPLHEISPLLFGQFCEQTAPENPERGADAAWDAGSGTLQREVVDQIRELKPGVIRFPGGTDVDSFDWTALVPNVPGAPNDGLRYKLGLDAFIKVCRDVGSEPLLVLNLKYGLAKEKPLADAALQAAGLVAYCNAEVGAKLPEGMPDWPALRAKNGSAAPFGVKYFQIGNESWFYDGKDADWKATVIEAYVDAMRAVDPDIQIIVDATPEGFPQLCRERLGDRINMLAIHPYIMFGPLDTARLDDAPVDWANTEPEEVWLGLVSALPVDPASGLAKFQLKFGTEKDDHGYKLAFTEWNWNVWGALPPSLGLDLEWIRAFGAATSLHGMMREPKLGLATQSMLVGNSWQINAIRVDPTGQAAPFTQPVGAVTGFYSRHHGRQLLRMKATHVPTYRQPFTMGLADQGVEIPSVDLVVTGSDGRIWVHANNRQFDEAAPVNIKLEGFPGKLRSTATIHLLQEDGRREESISTGADGLEVSIPPRSIASVELQYE